MIYNSNVVRPDPIVMDVLVLNTRQNISEYRVDYIVSLWLYESYCTIVKLLGRDSICFRSPTKTPGLSGVSTKSSFCVACSSWVLKRCNVIFGTLKPDPIFRGKRCTGLARPVDNKPMTEVTVGQKKHKRHTC